METPPKNGKKRGKKNPLGGKKTPKEKRNAPFKMGGKKKNKNKVGKGPQKCLPRNPFCAPPKREHQSFLEKGKNLGIETQKERGVKWKPFLNNWGSKKGKERKIGGGKTLGLSPKSFTPK